MRLWRSIALFCAGFLLGLPIWAQHNETINGHAAAANEVLVKLRPGVSLQADSYIVRAHDIRLLQALNRRGLMHLRSGSQTAAQLVAELSADPDVEYAEPNYVLHTTTAAAPAAVVPNDPLFIDQWALQNTGQTGGTAHADIDATQAWSITTGTATVVVGVVDTGLDYTHPDLQANIWSAPAAYTVQFAPGDSITCPAGSHGYDALNNVCDPMDQNDHGTHVSGIIGAVGDNSAGVSGINWTASIMGLRFLDASGSGTVAGAVRAIEFALQAKAVLGSQANLQVLSNSWGGTGFSQALLDEINDANTAGMLFVMAAGNSSEDLDTNTFYPASYRTPNAIAVAATDDNDALASFSDYGKGSVDLGAPGVNIVSTIPGANYETMSGTSMATPMVSGAAALVLAVCPLTTAQLRAALVNNVDVVAGLANTTISGGRLNVYKALASCAPGTTPAPGFTLSAPSAVVALTAGGASASTTITAAATGGFSGAIALAVTGLPAGVSAKLTPASIAPGATASLALTAASTAAAGTFHLTITGTSGTLSATTTVTLTVTAAPSFKLTVTPPSQTIRRGATGSFQISATSSGGFSGTISLQISGLPPYSSTTFSQTSSGAVAMSIATSPLTRDGSYTIQIVGTGTSGRSTVSQTVTATLTVTN
ncbi:MAG: S8 family serine peptidase [Bryobacteraceae bacterium]